MKEIVSQIKISLHKVTDAILGLYTLGLLQKKVQVLIMMTMKLIVALEVIHQQVKMKKKIVEKMGYQYQLRTVMALMYSGIGYRRKCSRLLTTSTLCLLCLQMDPN